MKPEAAGGRILPNGPACAQASERELASALVIRTDATVTATSPSR